MLNTLKVALLLSVLAACGDKAEQGTPASRVAVSNQATSSLSVNVVSADGSTTMTFSNVAAATSSNFQTVEFTSLSQVSVVVSAGQAMGGSLDLTNGRDNTIVLTASSPPTVTLSTNPDDGSDPGFW